MNRIIRPKAGAKKESKLKQSLPQAFMVSKISQLNVVNAADDFCPVLDILNPGQPLVKDIRCSNLIFHIDTVAFKRQYVKQKATRIHNNEKRKKSGKYGAGFC